MNRRQFLGLGPMLAASASLAACGATRHVTGTVKSLHHSGGGVYYRNHQRRRHPDFYYAYVATATNPYQSCRISHNQWVMLHIGDRVTNMACK